MVRYSRIYGKVPQRIINRILELYPEHSVRSIGKMLGINHKTVSKYLKMNNVKVLPKNGGYEATKPHKISWNSVDDRDKIICRLYREGRSSIYISKSLNISKQTVLRTLIRNNIERRDVKQLPVNIEEIRKLKDDGLSLAQISERLGISDVTLRKRLKNTNINFKPGDAMRCFAGFEDDITKMYEDGKSTYDIATYFKIPNPDTIARYLKKVGKIRTHEEARIYAVRKMKSKMFKSKLHKLFASMLDRMGLDYEEEYQIEAWTFDFRLPNNILVDMNGDYWHRLPGRVTRDRKKREFAESKNYKLIWIWEHQMSNGKFIENYVDNIVNNKSANFSFKDVDIQINRKNVRKFISVHHYSGKCPGSKFSVAFVLNNEIIGAIVYSSISRMEMAKKQGVSHKNMLELSRLAIHPNYHKRNFASWMVARSVGALKKYMPQIYVLISFADSTYNHIGTIYKASGWELNGVIKGDYWYVTPSRSILHKRTVWGRAKKEGITEEEYGTKRKLAKVWGHEKYRYINRLI